MVIAQLNRCLISALLTCKKGTLQSVFCKSDVFKGKFFIGRRVESLAAPLGCSTRAARIPRRSSQRGNGESRLCQRRTRARRR
jgi:hypothetical protein